jgi:FtsP/CotA-like multicopper oxidase with cupredoxin domain
MLKAQKTSIRSWALMPLTGMCCAIALITSGSALAADRDGGRRCRGGPISEAGTDPSGFSQPQVRRSRHGVLQTTLHACISTKEMLDQNAQPPTTVKFHPPTFEGTIPGPTLEVKPGDRLSILLVNDLPFNPPNGITTSRMTKTPSTFTHTVSRFRRWACPTTFSGK